MQVHSRLYFVPLAAHRKLRLHLVLHTGRLLDERVRIALREVEAHRGQGRVLDALLAPGPLPLS